MESEKVKEIKKALEQMSKAKYDRVAYKYNNKFGIILFADILTLITELERENEKLNKALVDNLEAYRDGFNEGANLRNKIDDKLKISLTKEIFADILNEENIETVYFTFDGNIRDKKVISLDTITTLARERGVEVKDIKYGK